MLDLLFKNHPGVQDKDMEVKAKRKNSEKLGARKTEAQKDWTGFLKIICLPKVMSKYK